MHFSVAETCCSPHVIDLKQAAIRIRPSERTSESCLCPFDLPAQSKGLPDCDALFLQREVAWRGHAGVL